MSPTDAERMTPRAFISYSSHDADDAVSAAAALEAQGVACWTAPRDVPPGSRYGEAIIDGINAARCSSCYSQDIPMPRRKSWRRSSAPSAKACPSLPCDWKPSRSPNRWSIS